MASTARSFGGDEVFTVWNLKDQKVIPFRWPHSSERAVRRLSNTMTVYEQFARVREQTEEVLHGLYHGMIEHPAFEQIENEAMDSEDAFFFACFADAFGIPSPVSYYTAELLPYLAEDFEGWERRMWDHDSVLGWKGDFHF